MTQGGVCLRLLKKAQVKEKRIKNDTIQQLYIYGASKLTGKTIFLTDNYCLFGISPQVVRDEDPLAIVLQADVPLALRLEDGCKSYKMVGTVYMKGLKGGYGVSALTTTTAPQGSSAKLRPPPFPNGVPRDSSPLCSTTTTTIQHQIAQFFK